MGNICIKCGNQFNSREQIVVQQYCCSCENEIYNLNHKQQQTEEERLLSGLDVCALYTRIYDWQKQNQSSISQKYVRPDEKKRYLKLVKELESPSKATVNDFKLVSDEIISGLMERVGCDKDEYNITMRTYAKEIETKIGGDFQTSR